MCIISRESISQRKGKESDSSKIACGFCEGSLAKGGLPKHIVHLLQCKGSSKKTFPLWFTGEFIIQIFKFSYVYRFIYKPE